MTARSFSSLALAPEFLENLDNLQYLEMTPIQAQSLPFVLAGKDVKAQAKTGSGKTAAFGIGLLQKIDPSRFETQALIICPTRELADQVSKELRRLARPLANMKIISLCGGVSYRPQLISLEHAPHVVVGTPGRLLKHLGKDSLKLAAVTTLVLDEADRMLDMGFLDDIKLIIEQCPTERQTLLFSATYPDEIEKISQSVQKDPVTVAVESQHDDSVIKQIFFQVEQGKKTDALMTLLQHYRPESSLIFCNRKQQCQDLCDELRRKGFHALALHGDMEQKERDQALVRFANKSISMLIATDVAARGLDIKNLPLVVNFELSPDPEVYVHRIGRTGRAGQEGMAISLVADSELLKVHHIESFQNSSTQYQTVPTLILTRNTSLIPPMETLSINSGRKNKLRPGDILGALTADQNLAGKQIGKIDIFDFISYVAIERESAKQALKILNEGKIKGRKHQVRLCKS
tara:strand:- start:103268 stop:104653 length:1386 start_codon:yes stop_codon:yes gene_type:complete